MQAGRRGLGCGSPLLPSFIGPLSQCRGASPEPGAKRAHPPTPRTPLRSDSSGPPAPETWQKKPGQGPDWPGLGHMTNLKPITAAWEMGS